MHHLLCVYMPLNIVPLYVNMDMVMLYTALLIHAQLVLQYTEKPYRHNMT